MSVKLYVKIPLVWMTYPHTQVFDIMYIPRRRSAKDAAPTKSPVKWEQQLKNSKHIGITTRGEKSTSKTIPQGRYKPTHMPMKSNPIQPLCRGRLISLRTQLDHMTFAHTFDNGEEKWILCVVAGVLMKDVYSCCKRKLWDDEREAKQWKGIGFWIMGVHVIWKHQKGMGFKVGCIVGERLGASNYTRSSTT